MDNFSRLNRDFHTPVLTDEVVGGLNIRLGGKYIDGTIGGGGHTEEILKRGGSVLGIDLDHDAISHLNKKFESEINTGKLILVCGNFAEIERISLENNFSEADGIILDLGLSSYQIEKSGRGFSFMRNESLDMRMSSETQVNAFEIVNNWGERELYEIFAKYGEEPNAKEVSRAIVEVRKNKKIETGVALAGIIQNNVRIKTKVHPATRIFQALRIVVNDEINNLKKGIDGGFKLLGVSGPHGRMEIISFHSLEDRVVKLAFLEFERTGLARIITKKPVRSAFAETKINRRARSAKLRIIERM